MARATKIYALYRGEENLADGTAKELAKKFNKTVKQIHYLATRHNQEREGANRLLAIVIGHTKDEM